MGNDKVRIYALDIFIAGELLAFAAGTLGSASNPETSSVGVVLVALNNKPIPVSSWYSEQIINAINAMSRGVGPEIGARYTTR